MKKLIYCAAALATALFAGSCQQELLDTPAGENTVTYTVEVPGVATKAIADGKNVDRLFYEVYMTDADTKADLSNAILLYKKNIPMVTSQEATSRANVTLNLVQNQNYTVLFWAQCGAEGQGVYNVANLRAVTYKDVESIESNHENYAAFYSVDCISDNTPRDKRIYLKRPFAQLNIGTDYTIDYEKDPYAIEMLKSKVTVKQVPTVFNVATSEVSGVQDLTFNMHDVLGDMLDVKGHVYKYVAMNYMFAGEKRTADVSYTINAKMTTQNGTAINDVELQRTVINVPLSENYRTNIVGNLLTSSTEYEVIVDEKWAQEEDKPYVVEVQSVASAQELVEAIENAATTEGETNIKLEGDIDLNDLFNVQLFSTKAGNDDAPVSLVIPAEKEVVLDLQGYTLSQKVKVAGHAMITNNGMLTLKGNGKVVYTYTGEGDSTNSKGNYTIVNNNKLTIDGPTVENATTKMSHAFYAVQNAGDLHIKNGKVLNTNNYAIRLWIGASKETSAVIDGGIVEGTRAFWAQLPSSSADAPVHNFTMNGGKLIGTGEKDYKLALYSYNYGNSLENISFTFNGGEVEGDIALTGGKNKENIETLNINGGTINGDVYSYGDAEMAAEAITIKGGVICGLEVLAYVKSQDESVEVKLTDDVELTSGYKFENEVASITIDGNGKTIKVMKAGTGRVIDFTSATNGANLTLKNLTIENNISWVERIVNYNTCGTLTLENVKITNAEDCSLNYAINLPGSSDDATVEINNCEIEAGAQALNLWGERTMVNVTNSRLYAVDNSEVEGYNAIALNNDGTNSADYSVINVIGGTLEVIGTHAEGSYTVRNNTVHGVVNVSETTVWNKTVLNPVAIIYWEGHNQYYSKNDLNEALEQAVPKHNATGVRMVNDLTLPLAKKAIYGTPVAVQMNNGGVFDGCGNTLSVENPKYNAYVVETYGGTIKNLNITTPAGRGIIISSPKEDIYLDNVHVNGPGYALNTTEHNGKKLVVTNSTFKGWTSLAGLESVSFTSCTFGENTYKYWQENGYDQDYDRLVRPYVQTLFDSCVFENGFYVDLSALAANSKVTLKNCVCGDVEVTAENYTDYITIELPSGRTLADCVVFE